MPIKNQDAWDKWVKNNTDAYGGCCINVARKVMEILDEEPDTINDTNELICRADKEVKAGGITGFMAGCIASMVTMCHSEGEKFKKNWNKSYDADDDRDGVINPALLTISTK